MIKSVRHLRADESEWSGNDIIVPDGEIAILKTRSGGTRLKVGNGEKRFSELPSITGEAVTEVGAKSITLRHGRSYRLGETASLQISFPDVMDDDYYSEVSFDSGIDATELEFSKKVRLTGDGVADEDFLPSPKTHYTVFIWYDGELQGIVRGLPNA